MGALRTPRENKIKHRTQKAAERRLNSTNTSAVGICLIEAGAATRKEEARKKTNNLRQHDAMPCGQTSDLFAWVGNWATCLASTDVLTHGPIVAIIKRRERREKTRVPNGPNGAFASAEHTRKGSRTCGRKNTRPTSVHGSKGCLPRCLREGLGRYRVVHCPSTIDHRPSSIVHRPSFLFSHRFWGKERCCVLCVVCCVFLLLGFFSDLLLEF